MISAETRTQIRHWFYAEHWKIGTIARELGIHPDTVRHAVEVDRFHRSIERQACQNWCELCSRKRAKSTGKWLKVAETHTGKWLKVGY